MPDEDRVFQFRSHVHVSKISPIRRCAPRFSKEAKLRFAETKALGSCAVPEIASLSLILEVWEMRRTSFNVAETACQPSRFGKKGG